MRLRLGPGALGFVLGALMTGLAVASAHADATWDRIGDAPTRAAPMPTASVVVATPTHAHHKHRQR
jgi:hypothetical protein